MGNYIATLLLGGVLSVPQGQVPVVAQSGVGYSTNTAVMTMPMSGVRCELTSFMDNGVVRTVNLCR
jgi:ABC-type arginine/histidine transport system permease subunit